jgi:hypothetical protein
MDVVELPLGSFCCSNAAGCYITVITKHFPCLAVSVTARWRMMRGALATKTHIQSLPSSQSTTLYTLASSLIVHFFSFISYRVRSTHLPSPDLSHTIRCDIITTTLTHHSQLILTVSNHVCVCVQAVAVRSRSFSYCWWPPRPHHSSSAASMPSACNSQYTESALTVSVAGLRTHESEYR